MKQFTMVFTTRHRNEDAVKKDCMLICECIVNYTTRYKYIYNGKELIVFHVYEADKDNRNKILCTILGNIQCFAEYKSLDLQSYTHN